MNSKPAYLFLHVEHQSTQDPMMAFRMIKYTCAIMDKHAKQHPEEGLPLVVPLVFYHGKQPYSHSTDIKALIEAPKDLVEQVLFQPFTLIDTHTLADEDLRERYFAGLMQLVFKHIFARDILPHIKNTLDMWQRVEQGGGESYIISLARYLSATAEAQDGQAVLILLAETLTKTTGEQVMTIAEQIAQKAKHEGILEGRLEGRLEGKLEGRLEGEAALLIRQLKHKFGAILPSYQERIEQADTELLMIWSERILDAATITEVFE